MTSPPQQPDAHPLTRPDAINLRPWFAAYALWMVALAVAALGGLREADAGSTTGLVVWMIALYAFYLSLCCTFFPAPTTWIVLWLASDTVAAQLGVEELRVARLLVVASIGALATCIANLNEYHVFTWLLRFHAIGRVRHTRLYDVAARWFATNPFLVIATVSLIPIPVDVIRWLAITCRYSRVRFFWAYFIGRWIRYAGWCLASIGLALGVREIAAIQVALVALALARVIPGIVRHVRDRSRSAAASAAGVVPASPRSYNASRAGSPTADAPERAA